MTWTRVSATVAVFLFISSHLAVSGPRKQSNTADADSVAIKKAVAAFLEAWNRHDAQAVVMLFADDADFTNASGLVTLHGRKEIEERFMTLFTGRLRSAHRVLSVRSIRFLTPDVASVDSDWEMTGAKADDGSDVPPSKGLFPWVMTRQGGQWLITVFHEATFVSTQTK